MSVYGALDPRRCGIVALNGQEQVTRFVEKPPWNEIPSREANAGVLMLDQALLSYVPITRPYDRGAELFPLLLGVRAPVYGRPIPRGRHLIDIETPASYATGATGKPVASTVLPRTSKSVRLGA